MKLSSWEALKQYREDTKDEVSLLNPESTKIILAVGEATCGIAAGSKKIAAVLQEESKKMGLDNVEIIPTGCYGCCYAEPMVEVRIPGQAPVHYGYVNEEAAKKIIAEHIVKGIIVDKNVLRVEVTST
ncbi:MAG: (2Fe-2S) ferredoxin domain-containing protein [Clostridiales bacterium]|jgi:(2Fe-2S) ferredoxin|nr:(2Fe-2S) ferredoxin domain-containing protein [Clostridiales bacterium]